jgi:hypothetical protein
MYPNILHIFSIVPCPKKSILLVYPHSLKYIHLSIFFLKKNNRLFLWHALERALKWIHMNIIMCNILQMIDFFLKKYHRENMFV